MPLVLTANSVPGESAWQDSALLGGGGAALAEILNKPSIAPDVADDYVQVVRNADAGVPITLTFTAPEDCTLRNLLFDATASLLNNNNEPLGTLNISGLFQLNRFEVTAGTGPNVGMTVLTAPAAGPGVAGLPCAAFTIQNALQAPTLDLALAQGDTFEIDIVYFGGDDDGVFNIFLTYDRAIDSSAVPTHFITPSVLASVGALNVAATGTIQVLATPVPAGDDIRLANTYAGGAFDFDLPFAGGNLRSVAGPRTSGSNDFNGSLGTVTAIRDDMLAALQDTSNNWEQWYDAVASGADSIIVTRKPPGSIGNSDTMTTASAAMGVSGMSGGLSPSQNIPFLAAPFDLNIQGVAATRFSFGGTTVPEFYNPFPPLIDEFLVNGSPSTWGPAYLRTSASALFRGEANVDVAGGDALSINVKAPNQSFAFFFLFGKPS